MPIAGVIFVAIGLVFLYLTRRARAETANQNPAQQGGSASLARLNEVMPSIVNFMLIATGAQITFFYFAMDLSDRISPVDLGGFLFLLACYGVHVTLQLRLKKARAS